MGGWTPPPYVLPHASLGSQQVFSESSCYPDLYTNYKEQYKNRSSIITFSIVALPSSQRQSLRLQAVPQDGHIVAPVRNKKLPLQGKSPSQVLLASPRNAPNDCEGDHFIRFDSSKDEKVNPRFSSQGTCNWSLLCHC